MLYEVITGVQTRSGGAEAELAGADAVLVGSALMRASGPLRGGVADRARRGRRAARP